LLSRDERKNFIISLPETRPSSSRSAVTKNWSNFFLSRAVTTHSSDPASAALAAEDVDVPGQRVDDNTTVEHAG